MIRIQYDCSCEIAKLLETLVKHLLLLLIERYSVSTPGKLGRNIPDISECGYSKNVNDRDNDAAKR